MDLIYSKTYPAVTSYKGKAKLEVDDFTIKKIVPNAYAVQQVIRATEIHCANENHTLLKTEVYWKEDKDNNYFQLYIYYLPAPLAAGMNVGLAEGTDYSMQSLQLPLLDGIVIILGIIAAIVITHMVTASWNRTVDAACDPKDKRSCAEQLKSILSETAKPFEFGSVAIIAVAAAVIYLASTGKTVRGVV